MPEYDYTYKIKTANDTFGTITNVTGGSLGTSISDMQIIPFDNSIRFARGKEKEAGYMQYHDKEYFFGEYTPTASWNYHVASPSLPATWIMDFPEVVWTTATEVVGNPEGYYYYKFVPVFDGNQEIPLGEAHTFRKISSAEKNEVIRLKLTIDTANMSKRLTSIKVYRGYVSTDVEPYYYHIKTIQVRADDNHPDYVKVASGNINRFAWDKNLNFTEWIQENNDLHPGGALAGNLTFVLGSTDTFAVTPAQVSTHVLGNYVVVPAGVLTGGITVSNSTLSTGDPGGIIEVSGLWSYTNSAYNGNKNTAGNRAMYGSKHIFSPDFDFQKGMKDNWLAYIPSFDTGATGTTDSERFIEETNAKHVSCNVAWGASNFHNNEDIRLSRGYRWDQTSTIANPATLVDLYFYDYGISDGGSHPLGGLDKVKVNYKYGAELNGRFFAGNVRLDPDDDAEDHKNMVIYSEIGQYDIMPVVNYIQIMDVQGGEITGMQSLANNLVVFMQYGIHVLTVPNYDPTRWKLEESYETVGCVAPKSLVKAENMLFFAGTDNIYGLTANLQIFELADSFKSDYVALSNLDESRFIVDVKKKRLICKLGSDRTTMYVFDIKEYFQSGVANWSKITSSVKMNIFGVDQNLKIHTADGEPSTKVSLLYDGSATTESFSLKWKSGIAAISDMGRTSNNMVRRMTMAYDSTDPITATLTFDKNPNTTKIMNFPANATSDKKYYSVYVGRRAKFIQLELVSDAATNYNTIINKLEVELDS